MLFLFLLGTDGELSEDNAEYPRVLLLMHEWFIKSKDLAQVFFDMYPFVKQSTIPHQTPGPMFASRGASWSEGIGYV